MDPHATQVIAQEVVKGITREETQTVGDPVGLVGAIIVIRFGLLSQFADGFGALLVGPRPHPEGDTIESVGGILLQDESVVHAVRLAFAGADFDIMRETGLFCQSSSFFPFIFPSLPASWESKKKKKKSKNKKRTYPHRRVQRLGHFIVLLQTGTAPQNLRQPELTNGTFHMTDLALSGSGSLDPLGGFAAHAADHVGMGESLGGALGGFGIHLRRNRLSDAGVKRGGATRNDQRIFSLIAGDGAVTGGRTGDMVSQRRTHDDDRVPRNGRTSVWVGTVYI